MFEYFAKRGNPLDERTLRCKKASSFGQMKIMNVGGLSSEQEPLDISLFKTKRKNDFKEVISMDSSLPSTEDITCKYLFGASYLRDAKQRDYTMNALYLEPFGDYQDCILDPLQRGYNDALGNVLCMADELSFKEDLGAQLRFWKMLQKGLVSEETTLLKVSKMLYLSISGLSVNELALDFFTRLQKKLFKDLCFM